MQLRLNIRHNPHFSSKLWRLLKNTSAHCTRAKRKRCYDVSLSRQEGSMRRHLGSAQYLDRPASILYTGRLFLAFGRPVYADQISNCPLDRIYLCNKNYHLLNSDITNTYSLRGQLHIARCTMDIPHGSIYGN